jgi:hypothetical protein
VLDEFSHMFGEIQPLLYIYIYIHLILILIEQPFCLSNMVSD